MPPFNKPVREERQEQASAIEAALLAKVQRMFFSKRDFHPGGVLDLRYYTKSQVDALLSVSWAALPLNTGGNWANYGGSYATAAYRKIGDTVELRGMVARSSGSATLMGTLPAGSRPAAYERWVCNTGGGGFMEVEARTNGEVHALSTYSTFVSLSGIRFSIT